MLDLLVIFLRTHLFWAVCLERWDVKGGSLSPGFNLVLTGTELKVSPHVVSQATSLYCSFSIS